MTAARKLHYSYREYLNLLASSDVRLEYADGVIYAMAGGTPAHGALGLAAGALLRQALAGSCTAFSSDVKVRIDSANQSVFPDGSVVCGATQRSQTDEHALVNPSIIVEVTSKSTEDYDRGDKLALYQQLPSVRAVLLVSHRLPRVTVVERDGASWSTREFVSGDLITLKTPAVTFSVEELYRGIQLDGE